MTSILIIDKSGAIKGLKAKDLAFDNLHKKAGFKSAEGFQTQTTWNVTIGQDAYCIQLYGKTAGKAGQENKYDFPPPVDTKLFFGSCVLLRKDSDRILDLSEETWTKIYTHLFGGFEDLDGSEDEDEMDTEEELDAMSRSTGKVVKQTKQGYVNDGFVVDSDEEENPRTAAKKVIKKVIKVQITKKTTKKKAPKEPEPEPEENTYLDCTSELKEEEYV